MDTNGVSEALNGALDAFLAAVATAVAAVAGGVLNAWAARRKQRDKDLLAAILKLREIQDRMGMLPEELETMDDVFCAIRRINAALREEKP